MTTVREDKLAALASEPGAAAVIIDRQAQIRSASPGVVGLFGRTAEELVGTDTFSFVHPDDVNTTVNMIVGVLDTPGAMCRLRVRVTDAAGEWIRVSAEAINRFDDDDIDGLVVVLRRSGLPEDAPDANPLEQIFPPPKDVVMIADDTFTVTYVSPSARAVFGFEPEHLRHNYAELVHPDDLPATMAFAGKLTAATDGRTVHMVCRIRDAAGRWRTVETSAVNLLADPDFRGCYSVIHDLTDELEADSDEQQGGARFQAAVASVADPLVLVDAEGRISFATPPAGTLTGRTGEELVGARARDLVDPDDHDQVDEWFRHGLDHPDDQPTCRFRLADHEASPRWVNARLVNLLDDDAVRGLLIVMREVTEQVAAERALQASEARWRALVQNAPDCVMVFGPDRTCTFASPSMRDVMGISAEECIGIDITRGVHPDDRQGVVDTWEKARADPNSVVRMTARVRTGWGEWHWFESTLQDHVGDPDVGGVVVNFRDVTDRTTAQQALSASERRFRALVQHSFEITTVVDEHLSMLWISPSITELLGWVPDEVVGLSAMDFVHPDDHEMALEHLAQVVDGASPRPTTTVRVRSKDGAWHHLDVSASDRLNDPDVGGFIFNLRDADARVNAEHALKASELRYRSLAESSPSGTFQLDPAGHCTYVNDRWCEITGMAAADVLLDEWRELFDPDAVPQPVYATHRTQLRLRDGGTRWVDVRTAPVTDDDGRVLGTVATLDDVDEQVQAMDEARRLTTILETTPDLVGIADRSGSLVYLNRAARDFFGLSDDVDLGHQSLSPFVPQGSLDRWVGEVRDGLKARGTWQGELSLVNRDGVEVEVSAVLVAHRKADGTIELVSGSARDISDRKALEARLEHEATHDPLTGLPNRTLLLDRLEMAMGRAHRQHRTLAVLFLDLDHFKVVNDSLGHSTGDQLLTATATRLSEHVRPGDTVARFGGDEFVIICEELSGPAEAEEIASRIADAVAESLWIADAEVYVTASVGIALASELHQTPEQVLRDADAAMYQAKARGRSRHEVFDSRLRTRALDRLEVESALRRALVRHELRVHYQPVFDLGTGAVVGVEALLRWEHPQRGLLLPAEFLRVAEETGLVVPVGSWVLRQACRQIQRLRVEVPGYEHLQVAVNLSARQIGHPYLVDELAKMLDDTQVGPDTLVLEITESVLMDDVPANGDTLRRLKDLGVRLAIDDFGTGYSSLAYLRRFPVDVLKVDRSFVSGLGDDPEDAAIANAVVTLAHTLGLVAVAEGVETPEQRDELIGLGCDQAQGFLLGRPMNSADLADFLVSQGPPPATRAPV